jgi:hypothetical protein
MFEGADVFGGTFSGGQAGYEDPTPALPGGQATGASPDGISGDGMGNVQIPLGNDPAPMQAAAGPPVPPGAAIIPTGRGGAMAPAGMQGQTWDAMEPTDVSPAAAVRSAGFTALIVAASMGVGYAAGGPWGAGAGLLLAGAAANGYRAQKWWDSAEPSEKHEAVVSGVFSAGAVGMGVYMAYKAYQQKQEE